MDIIRLGKANEINKMWGNNNMTTQNYFVDGIKNGNIEFWVVEDENTKEPIGELHIFWDSEDKDEANGIDRAYLCAFRIDREYQGEGLGSKLMKKVIERVKEKSFKEVTIGVDDNADKLIKMYNSWGFEKHVKTKTIDHHNIDLKGNPKKEDPFRIYLKKL